MEEKSRKKTERNINLVEMFNKVRKKSPMLRVAAAICLAILFYFLLSHISVIWGYMHKINTVLRPFVIGVVMAYLVRPFAKWSERLMSRAMKKKPHPKLIRAVSTTLSLLLALAVIAAMVWAIVPNVISSIMSLTKTLPDTIAEWYSNTLEALGNYPEIAEKLTDLYESAYSAIGNFVTESLIPNIDTYIGTIGSGAYSTLVALKDFIIGIFVMVYLLAGRERFKHILKRALQLFFKESTYDIVVDELRFTDTSFNGFINGKILDSVIIGCIAYVFCLITRMPSPILIAVVIGVTNIIPFFGPFIGAIPSCLFIFVQSPIKALWFAIFILALQQLDGNLIGPKILGNTTGVSSFWVLFSIVLFGGLWGLPGMVIAVPTFAVFRDILKKFVRWHDEKVRRANEEALKTPEMTGITEDDSGDE